MRKHGVGILLAAVVAVVPSAAGLLAMSQAPAAESGFRTVEKGSQSNVDAARQVVVRSTAEWTALWKSHDFDRPVPRIDFDKEMVLAVFMGSRPTGGYAVAITSVAERDGSLVVGYRETSPRPGMMTTQILTFPFHIVAVPKRAGTVVFEKAPNP